jgi:hypothetical protein
MFVEGQVSVDVVDQQHELTVQMERARKTCFTETLKYHWPLLGSRIGEAPHSHINRDSVIPALPAGKYAFGICALFIQSTGTNKKIQFLTKI